MKYRIYKITYKDKDVFVDAMKWNGTQKRFDELRTFCPEIVDGGAVWYPNAPADSEVKTNSWPLFLHTKNGTECLVIGDWLIKNGAGEFSACTSSDFQENYESIH